jgi:hypothetical protein
MLFRQHTRDFSYPHFTRKTLFCFCHHLFSRKSLIVESEQFKAEEIYMSNLLVLKENNISKLSGPSIERRNQNQVS